MAKHKKSSPAKKTPKAASHPKHRPTAKTSRTKVAAPVRSTAGRASAGAQKSRASTDLKRRLLERKSVRPIAFSLDEVREIAKKNEKKVAPSAGAGVPARETAKAAYPPKGSSTPPVPHHIKAASLADILGFNPKKHSTLVEDEEDAAEIPEKYRRFYRLLMQLRTHVLEALGQHSEETLKRSAKDDAGDLSGYGQHMADAGTDTFDRDFALSLVSSEQDALSEIEAALARIHAGTYGVCELTGKPISRDRLLAVPFTRYSAEAQKELEKTKHRSIQRAGIFADATGEEGGKLMDEEPEE